MGVTASPPAYFGLQTPFQFQNVEGILTYLGSILFVVALYGLFTKQVDTRGSILQVDATVDPARLENRMQWL